MIVLPLLIYFFKAIGGFLIIHLIWDSRQLKILAFKFFLGVGAGTGISSLLYFLWCWFKFPAVIYPYIELGLFIILIIVNLMKEKRNKIELSFHLAMPSRRRLLWGVLFFLAVTICMSEFRFIITPHGLHDAWGIWNVSARFIYGASNSWLEIIPQSAWFNPDYPLFVSINIAQAWSILGNNTVRAPIAFQFIFLLGLIGLVYTSVTIGKDDEQGALASILMASLPLLSGMASIQYADLVLSYFFLATGALLYLYTMTQESRLIILAGLFAGCAGWTKNEGLSFILVGFILCLSLSLIEKKNLLKFYILGLLLPVIVVILFKSIVPPSYLFIDKTEAFFKLFDISRYQIITLQIIESLLHFGGWPLGSFLAIFGGYILIIWKNDESKGKIWLPILLVIFQSAGYFVVYLITPSDLGAHLNTSLLRLIFHVFPLTLFSIFILLRSPLDIFPQKPLLK